MWGDLTNQPTDTGFARRAAGYLHQQGLSNDQVRDALVTELDLDQATATEFAAAA